MVYVYNVKITNNNFYSLFLSMQVMMFFRRPHVGFYVLDIDLFVFTYRILRTISVARN